MCITHSESGQPCGFVPCDAYKKTYDALASEQLRADKAEAENATLREELDTLRAVAKKADAMKAVLDKNRGECPGCQPGFPCSNLAGCKAAKAYQEARHG